MGIIKYQCPCRMNPADIDSQLVELLKHEEKRERTIKNCASFVLKNRGSWEDAKEIFSEAVFSVLSKSKTKTFHIQGSLSAYLNGTCRNLWLNRLKKRGDAQSIIDKEGKELPITDFEDGIAEKLEVEMSHNLLLECFSQLDERCKKILDNFYWKKASFKDIALELDITDSNARKIAERCREKLKKCINKKKGEMESTYNQEEIEKYIREEMSPEELIVFNKKMESDPQLTEQVSFQKELSETILFKNLIGNALDKFEEKGLHEPLLKAKKPGKVFDFRRYLSLAAVILLLLGLGAMFNANLNFSNQALSALTLEEISLDQGRRNQGANANPELTNGYEALKGKDFHTSRAQLSLISHGDPDFPLAQLYLAYVEFEEENYEKAISYLDSLIAMEQLEPRLRNRAEWLNAKTLLASGKISDTQILLEKIIQEPGHVFHDDALLLSQSLDSFWRNFAF